MADEHAAEPPPGTPGQRALGAMESAVRRARAAAGAAPLPPSQPPPRPPQARTPQPRLPPPRPTVAAAPVDAAPPLQNGRPPARPDRWLVGSVAVVAVLVVIAAVALAVSLSGSPAPTSSTVAGPTQSRTPSSHPSSTGGGKSGAGGSSGSTSSSTTTSTTVVVAPGGPPVISSLNPSSGTAGQGIQVAGSNFLSTSGQIVATFNGQVAPTSCPAQNTCTITVPPSTSPSAQVVITTTSGTSNAVTFTYS